MSDSEPSKERVEQTGTPGSSNEYKDDYPHDTSSSDYVLAPESPKSIGIRKVELLNKQYHTPVLRTLFFVCIFFVSYCYAIDGTLRLSLQAYATSSYSQHSLLSTINVIKAVVAAAAQPTYARLSDKFGRLELTIISIIFYAMGTVIQSQAYDVYRFAGGSVLYQVGYSGIIIMLQIVIADFSNLNWRLTASMVPALPFIINTWVSGDILSSLYPKHSWNYSIGIWAFIFPLSCVPLLACFIHMLVLARRTDEWKRLVEEERLHRQQVRSGKSFVKYLADSSVELFWKLDVVGILFVVCVFGFILVPLTIAGGVTNKWKRGSTIAPLVIGFVLIPFFVLWEGKYARHPIMPLPLMRDRGVWSALLIGLLIDFVWYMPNDFMYTVLIVGMRASIKAATRITSLYSFVSVIVGPLLGLFIVRFKHLKVFIIFGTVCWIISLGLLFHFRGGNNGTDSEKYLNGVIGSLCLMGFGAGFFTYPTQVSIQTCTNHEYMAIMLSLYLASYNVGLALGASVSGAIWTNEMYPAIVREFNKAGLDPAGAQAAYGAPFKFILTNVWGTPERIAVVLAYAHVQRYLCIAGLVLCFPLLVFSLFLRDHRLDAVQSLELENGAERKEIVVNNQDEDIIIKKIKSLFKRK
ncbi:MFS general substrate transporter [Suhomyces tanzawaensis NRRL Y-17324]|uniref:MFS general substrate transporter n=1 Tax=Suhomyces tanzawaensis NRRL Y-17324 TaxID=984487 RepID=A0A1E4SK44_9ASCO|nr:MFS general substrate transporter [Suhomyces tanzawaensis NRRL Y-17324]ODV79885.1 MFS general substrate transporter [Suhomyces tanzawaensis NRRL Y-17324]